MHTDPRTWILMWSRIQNNWLNKRFFYIIKSTLKTFWRKAFGNHNVKFTFDHVLSSFLCKWNYWSFYWLWFCLFLPSFLPSCKHLNLETELLWPTIFVLFESYLDTQFGKTISNLYRILKKINRSFFGFCCLGTIDSELM